jgi:hypothetical protein
VDAWMRPERTLRSSFGCGREVLWCAQGSGLFGGRLPNHSGVGAGNRSTLDLAAPAFSGTKPMRASAPADPGSRSVRISAESKALKLRGIVTSWSSE